MTTLLTKTAKRWSLFFSCMACVAWLAYVAGPSKATMLPVSPALGMGPVGAAPRLDIIFNSQPLYTKGWATLRVNRPGDWSELVLEVMTPPTLPESAHLHVVVTPVLAEERTVSRPNRYTTSSGTVTPYPNWPTHSGTVVPTVRLSDEWLGDPSHAFVAFQDRVFTPPVSQARQASPAPPPLRALEPTYTGQSISFPVDLTAGALGSNGAKTSVWQSVVTHPDWRGREADPGGTLRVTLPAFPASWAAARIALALYHQHPSGEDVVFRLDQPGGTLGAAQQQYTNDPFFLARPWVTTGQDPMWLANWHFLHPSETPWPALSSEPVLVLNQGANQRTFFLGESPNLPYALYDAPNLLPWTRIIGREQALWLMAWSTNVFELEHWIGQQPHPTNDDPSNSTNLPQRHALLPSHSFLAEWSQLTESLLLPTAPFFKVDGPFPKRWVLPTLQYSPLGDAAHDFGDIYTPGHRAFDQGLVALSDWPAAYRTHPNPLVEGRLNQWPRVYETEGAALATGTTYNIPLNTAGSPLVYQPSLPPLFHQWEAYTGTEWMTMVLHAHGVWWAGIKDWLVRTLSPTGWLTVADLLRIETEFRPWWDWVEREASTMTWPEPVLEHAMSVAEAGFLLELQYGAYGAPGMQGDPDPVITNLERGGHGLEGLDSMSQPVHTLPAVSYAIQRLRLYGKPRL